MNTSKHSNNHKSDSKFKPKLQRQIIVTLIGAASIALAIGISSENTENFTQQGLAEKKPDYPKVSIANVSSENYKAKVTAYGSATPRFSLDLTAEVSGRVTYLSKELESGNTLEKGALLVAIDDRPYQQAVASAQTQLSNAHVSLLQEKLNVKQALQEWQRSGLSGQPDSELVLREPQLAAAKNTFAYAEKLLTQAKADLQKTQVKAPFSSLIINRQVQPSGYLQSGSQIAQLYSTEVLDISLALSDSQWQQLPPLETMINQHWPVQLTSNTQQAYNQASISWIGTVTRGEQHIDNTSRQRSLIVSIKNPLELNPPLYPGTFVEANINGQNIDNLWQLPASAITQSNQLWYLNNDDTLHLTQANIRFSKDDKVYVEPITNLSKARILVHPLSSYLAGMKVEPSSDENIKKNTIDNSNMAEVE